MPPTLSGFLQLGVPVGLAIMVEVTSFTLMALFIARQGTHGRRSTPRSQPTWPHCCTWRRCRWPIATSTRVSYWLGAGQALRAQRVVYIGFRLAALTGIALAAILFIVNHEVVLFIPTAPPWQVWRQGCCCGWRLSPGGCIANAVRLRAAKLSHHRRPLGGVLRIAVGAGAGAAATWWPTATRAFGAAWQHHPLRFGRAVPWHLARHRSGVCGEVGEAAARSTHHASA